jgi:hypothetical protein
MPYVASRALQAGRREPTPESQGHEAEFATPHKVQNEARRRIPKSATSKRESVPECALCPGLRKELADCKKAKIMLEENIKKVNISFCGPFTRRLHAPTDGKPVPLRAAKTMKRTAKCRLRNRPEQRPAVEIVKIKEVGCTVIQNALAGVNPKLSCQNLAQEQAERNSMAHSAELRKAQAELLDARTDLVRERQLAAIQRQQQVGSERGS